MNTMFGGRADGVVVAAELPEASDNNPTMRATTDRTTRRRTPEFVLVGSSAFRRNPEGPNLPPEGGTTNWLNGTTSLLKPIRGEGRFTSGKVFGRWSRKSSFDRRRGSSPAA